MNTRAALRKRVRRRAPEQQWQQMDPEATLGHNSPKDAKLATRVTADRTFEGEIVVASKIVDYLSSGLYRTPAACLKELVNNAYDANATKVSVFIKPDADRIVIEDDGEGMTRDEFQEHFSHVSESRKREDSDTTASGRPKIGLIGIGFIAANEICDEIEVVSTKKGSRQLLRVRINFEEMRKDAALRRRDGKGAIAKADYEGEVTNEADRDAHYTWLFLSRIRGETNRSIMASAARARGAGDAQTLYGLPVAEAVEVFKNPDLDNWSELDRYSENLAHIGLNVPVQYYPGWYPVSARRELAPFEAEVRKLGFSVTVDGAELRKPIVFRTPEKLLCERFDFKGKHVGAKGYFYAQRRGLRPTNLQGILLRIRHAAVGDYDPTFWEFPPEEARLFQSWTSAEVWADSRLEEAMNIDRRTLRVAHPAYVELQNALHEQLRSFWKKARKELYAEPAAKRRLKVARKEADRIAELLAKPDLKLSAPLRRQITSSWRRTAKTEDGGSSALARRFSVSELYEEVVAAAREVLSPTQAERFLAALTRRLRR